MFKQGVAFVSMQLRLLHTTSSGNETLNLANCWPLRCRYGAVWTLYEAPDAHCRMLSSTSLPQPACRTKLNACCGTLRGFLVRLSAFSCFDWAFSFFDSTRRFVPFPDPGLTPHPLAERRFGRLSKCKEILGSPRHSLLPPLRACLGRSERRHRLPAYSGVGSYFCDGI